LYVLSNCKDKTIQQLGEWNENKWEWHLGWRRNRRVWETIQEQELMNIIKDKPLKKETFDT